MSAPTNHWKLGAFVVGSILLGLTAVVILAARTLQVETVPYTSYFDEGVAGLEVGSPVTFRGVKIGNVSAIDIAPDRRHVEINYALGIRILSRLGLAPSGEGKETRIAVPPDLRVQIASTGLTGTKYIQLDFFNVEGDPPPTLPFPVPENYIPATPSTMKNLEDAVTRAVDLLPELTVAIGKVLEKVNLLLEDVGQRGIPAKTAATLVSANQMLATLQSKLGDVKTEEISRDTTAVLRSANVAMQKLQHALERLDGEKGLLASVQRTTDSLGDATSDDLGPTINDTARDLREAATALRDFLEALDRDPDMLLKGKAKAHP